MPAAAPAAAASLFAAGDFPLFRTSSGSSAGSSRCSWQAVPEAKPRAAAVLASYAAIKMQVCATRCAFALQQAHIGAVLRLCASTVS